MRYFDTGGKRAFWVCHRRAGKDLTALHQIAKMAVQSPGLYWHMLPTYRQARKVIWQGFRNDSKRFIDNAFPAPIVAARNEQDMRLELKNGAIIQFVGSDNYDTLVGSNPRGVVFSEFALNHPSAWEYLRPIMTMNKEAWASFVTTPRGLNHAWRLFNVAKQDPSWFCETQTIYDTQALPASILEEERKAGMPDAMIRQEYLCDWQAALVGSVWGDLLEELQKRGGLVEWPAAQDEVFTVWDLGMSDSTAIWFMRVTDGVEFIDHYENHGKPLSHYAEVIEKRGYRYLKHWVPHDANARHLGTEMTVIEQLRRRFGPANVAIAPRTALLDGIQAGRWLLQQPGTRFHPRCEKGVEALRAYHYEYDEESRTYGSKPEHDWSSHTADAFRYAAVVCKVSGIFRPKRENAPAPEPRRAHQYTLDMLYEMRDSKPFARRLE